MKTKPTITKLALFVLVVSLLVTPEIAGATVSLGTRSVKPSTSAGGATGVTYTATFTLGTNNENLGSILFEICDSPLTTDACVGTAGSSGASFGSATFGSVSGLAGSWSANAGTAGGAGGTSILFKKAAAGAESGTPTATVVINNVTNPTVSNTEYYVRISTYTNTTGSAPSYPGTDFGAEAMSTAAQISVTGTMPESLVFCVGTSGTNCGNITGTAVNLGTFSPLATNTGTSLMDVSTNAGSGYAITVNGTVPTSGSNTIAAMGTQSANSSGCAVSCTSAVGNAQFGSNVRANTAPSVGADVSPTGAGYNGAGFGGYNTINSFRFFAGDTVASSSQVSNAQLFTNSYIVNVSGSQPAGLYTTTMTYICTATF